jgi:hypothetical protein
MVDDLMSLPHLSSQKEQTHCRLGLRKHSHPSYGERVKLNTKIQCRSFKVKENNNIQHVINKANIRLSPAVRRCASAKSIDMQHGRGESRAAKEEGLQQCSPPFAHQHRQLCSRRRRERTGGGRRQRSEAKIERAVAAAV